jgi:hypothetical protein
MGTRADFYVGRGPEAEWLGSVAWDGYELDEPLRRSTNEQQWRNRVEQFLASRDDGTTPDMGWPWPWEDSRTTDFAYAYDGGKVWASCFGHAWFDPNNPPADEYDEDGEPQMAGGKTAVFPDMTARKNVARGGKRSGLIVIEAKGGDA